jgi:adenylyl- and sulfurtransferase ThiI
LIDYEIEEKLSRIFGIMSYFKSWRVELDLEKLKKLVLEICNKEEFKTFGVFTIRKNKVFSSTSIEVCKEIGGLINQNTSKPANLKNPDLAFNIEDFKRFILVKFKS